MGSGKRRYRTIYAQGEWPRLFVTRHKFELDKFLACPLECPLTQRYTDAVDLG